ncbi:MAG: potassium transporter TrkG, partial [Candidatus Ornithospirochaeta sp.]
MKSRHVELGKMTGGISLLLLLPLPFIPFMDGEAALLPSFLIPFSASALVSIVINKKGFHFKSPSSTVTFIWLYGAILLSFPFALNGNASFIASLFESVSGLTTTGLSVLDVEKLPKTLLLYRAMLQYVGGLGFVMMILLLIKGKEAAELFDAEGHIDRVRPSIRETASSMVLMYIVLMISGAILYTFMGMTVLDYFVHAMCALSTGGFSNKVVSIGAYSSTNIEIITAILMVAGATDFLLLIMLTRGKVRDFFRSSEPRTMLSIFLSSSLLIVLVMMRKGFSLPYSIRL